MIFKSMPLGPLGTNCYIVHNGNKEALIVDPGGEPEKVISYINEEQLEPQVILLTHAHFDHIGAVDKLRKTYNIKVFLHEEESKWLEKPELNGSSRFMGGSIKTDDPDEFIKPGKMQFGTISFEAVHTPGHSPGSVTFIFDTEGKIISGDVLFNRGIGRTDLPGGSYEVLERSILHKIYPLPDSYVVYPGHGPETQIGVERQSNPFVTDK